MTTKPNYLACASILLALAAGATSAHAQATWTKVGVGTAALLGGDRTDPENDGQDFAGAEADLAGNGWNFVNAIPNEEPGFEGGEFSFNIFDNKLEGGNGKWCCNARNISIELDTDIVLTHFTVSSANDVPNRDWNRWRLLTSSDGGVTFDVVIHEQLGADEDGDPTNGSAGETTPLWDQRHQVIRFDVLPAVVATLPLSAHYRFEADSNWGDGLWQIGEVELFGDEDNSDTDGDGLPDRWEIANLPAGAELDDGTVNPDFGPDGDPDNDTLTNLEEFTRGTNPQNDDTDNDGLKDNVETNTGTYVDATDTGTNPTSADTDKDGLLDGVETNTGIFVSATDTGTDPHNPNTDGDRRNDGDEVALGTDPNDPNDPGLPSPGDLAAELTVYYNFDGNMDDIAHTIPTSASTVADNLTPASGHSGAFGPGLFGDGGYLGSGPGTGHFETPDSADVDPPADQQFTVSWWGRHDVAFNAGWQCGVAKGEGNNWRFHRTGGDNGISWQGGGGDINSVISVNDMQWHHFLGTKEEDGSRILYVDGVQVATGGAGTPIADTANPMMVGENPQANNREWQGDIDDVAIWHRALSSEDVEVIYANGLAGKSLGVLIGGEEDPFGLAVRNVGGQLEISWNSTPGNLYDLVSNLDLASDIESWAAFGANTGIPATPDRNTLTIPYPADAERYFAIKQYPVPPEKAFSDDFEGGQGSWVTADSGVPFPPNLNPSSPTATKWELGTPDPGVAGGPPAAHSGTNCFGTDLDAAYVEDTGISLTSPAIDLTNFVGGTLVYWQYLDIETTFDFGTVRLLDAADDSEIAVLQDTVDGTITDWEEVRIDLPAEAAGKSVKIQFTFACDNFNTNPQAGFYLDDFCVEAVPE